MTDSGVPYQAYRSKRHYQTLSSDQPVQQKTHFRSLSQQIPAAQTTQTTPVQTLQTTPVQTLQTTPVQTLQTTPVQPNPAQPSPVQSSSVLSQPSTPTPGPSSLAPTSTFRRVPRKSAPPTLPTPAPAPAPAPLPPPLPSPAPPVASTPSTRPPSSSSSLAPQQHRIQAPYRPGFQPRGLYRHLTDDFIALRRLKRDGDPTNPDANGTAMKRVERTKLTRRFQKLVDLHFPPSEEQKPLHRHSQTPTEHSRRASSFFDFKKINVSDPGGLWRGVVGGADLHDIREAEQRITPWQDDADVSKCPLCVTSFHPLTNRKHHCRLCGQIICSLPIKHPHRPLPCSLLFIVDPKTRRIEEVQEGVDYGVRKKPMSNGDGAKPKPFLPPEEKFLKGVRICRTCRPILLHQQHEYEVTHIPTIGRLYEAFVALEEEIKDALPQFQELVLSLSHNDQPSKEASISRKRLLEAFAQYDDLAKRIRKLPCTPGSSADQVQASIMNRASLFLQKHMFPLQSLPTPKRAASKTPTPAAEEAREADPDSELALALQPLLEQEALLESFVEEAKAHRKFEDVKTLKANLGEIRAEIEKLVANSSSANGNGNGNGSAKGNHR
ncbi:hypothetical protein H0H92_013417 [Tricholoma furcatifolium]|nr:hypothetical protein H0H92_013417 [Tricholoma furcatifolium]